MFRHYAFGAILMWLMAAMPLMAANKKALHIKAQLQGVGDTLVVIHGEEQTLFTGHDGTFDFLLPLPHAMYIEAATPASFRGEEQQFFRLPAVPGETVEIKGTLPADWTVSGSRFYADYQALITEVMVAEQPLSDLTASLNQQILDGGDRDSLQQVYNQMQPAMLKTQNDALLAIVRRHADNPVVAVMTAEMNGDIPMMQQAIALMARPVREGKVRQLVYGPLEQAKMQRDSEEASARKQAAGVEVPDFTLTDIHGQPLQLSSLRGRYVLLDFWGSWCGWCKEGFPQMRRQYEQYKDKFEILGIDCRDSQEAWRQTVKEFDLPWLHVYCPDDSSVFEAYGIIAFPTKILIGPDGKIVKTFVGEDPLYYSLIDELFGE